ncbi:MAG: EamA family transporter [Deltaproteobacteria bacterium]|nr:EamA family transporter [Deltaproteobacteria bacterium]
MIGANEKVRGAVFGLSAAALFGLSAPLAKLLLGEVRPVLLAGLLYLGAAIGLWLHRGLKGATKEAPLGRADVPNLALVVILGGVAGPVSMLVGLSRVGALTGSLLLNLEAPFTVLVAVLFFREHLGIDGTVAVALILGGALVLKLQPGGVGADALGVALLGVACLCWAIDNNLTQRLSLRDPFAIVRVKTLVAGLVNTVLGLTTNFGPLPEPPFVAAALVLGSLSYGVSVVLDAYALRLIGAAREAAYFATAPFVGALFAAALLGEGFEWGDFASMGAMGLGVVFLLRERHTHEHTHEELKHEHLHEHDAHHQHEHRAADPAGEPHSHLHTHPALVHDHPHVSDGHHRHRH